MRGQRQAHPVISDVDIGMVLGAFCKLGHLIHKIHGRAKIPKLEFPYQSKTVQAPSGKVVEAKGDLCGRKKRHGGIV